MMSEMQVQMVARQMIEKHGFVAIAEAAQKAQDCERKGDAEEAKEWRHRRHESHPGTAPELTAQPGYGPGPQHAWGGLFDGFL